ncbi:hypothetical protein IGI47_002274 [Enterococcus sp. AZ191]
MMSTVYYLCIWNKDYVALAFYQTLLFAVKEGITFKKAG